jgi:hypothetical protein
MDLINMETDKLIELLMIIGICFSIISTVCDYKRDEYNMDVTENLLAAVGLYVLSVDESLDLHLHKNYNHTLNISEIARTLNIDQTDIERSLGENFTAAANSVFMIKGNQLVKEADDFQNKRTFWVVGQYIAMICALGSNILAIFLVLRRKEKVCI